MRTSRSILALAILTLISSPETWARPVTIAPPGIPVEVTVDAPAIDPGLAELILIGVDMAGRKRVPTEEPMPRPEEGEERIFQGDLLITTPSGQAPLLPGHIYNPVLGTVARPGLDSPDYSYLNRFRAYFSTASGGFGLRIGYDRRIRSDLRMTAGTEFLTYGLPRAVDILGAQLPENVTRITLMHLPLGIQKQFSPESRVVPHVGIAAGPVVRFDHHPGLQPGFYPGYIDLRTGRRSSSLDLTIRNFEDFPTLSLTMGGYAETAWTSVLGTPANTL